MEDQFYRLTPSQRIVLVREALKAGQPLMIRWAEVAPDFGDRWQARAVAAATWLTVASSVADLGCGSMNLERCLRADQRYFPVDLVRRDERTLVLDLNKPSDLAHLPKADACALLGVIEYSYVPNELLDALRGKYRQVVASFNVFNSEQNLEGRLSNGWVVHFTYDEILEMFYRHGFILSGAEVCEERRLEHLFNFHRQI